MIMKTLFNRATIALCRALPRRLAAHAMFLLRQNPDIADRWGYHVRPIHYYDPIPDFQVVSADRLRIRREPVGVKFDLPEQADRLEDLYRRFGSELRGIQDFNFRNDYFADLDAAVYYALIRDLQPSRVIEIGAGYSTQIAAKALAVNKREGKDGELIVIEPYPEPRLTDAGVAMQLITKRVEEIDPSFFKSLGANDILFIDSSHALRCGGDVFVEFLEIIPRLGTGVWVHIHDIFLPFDYPVEWVMKKRLAFNEQYLLEAFLSFNEQFSVEISNHWLANDYPQIVAQMDPVANADSRDTGPSSFWMRRK